VVVEGAGADAEEFGDRGDAGVGVGQHVAGCADDLGRDDGRAAADAAARSCGGEAFAGTGDDEFADELGAGGEDVEDEPAGRRERSSRHVGFLKIVGGYRCRDVCGRLLGGELLRGDVGFL
jgi:hypothetical protein